MSINIFFAFSFSVVVIALVALSSSSSKTVSAQSTSTTGTQHVTFFGRTFVLNDFVTYQPFYCDAPTNATNAALISSPSAARSNNLPFGGAGDTTSSSGSSSVSATIHPFNNKKIRDLKRCTEITTYFAPQTLALPPIFRSDEWDTVAPEGSCFRTLEHRLYEPTSSSTNFVTFSNGTIDFATSPAFNCTELAQELVRGFWCAVGAANTTGYVKLLKEVGFFDSVKNGLVNADVFNCIANSGDIFATLKLASDIIQKDPSLIQVRTSCGDGTSPPTVEFCNTTLASSVIGKSLFRQSFDSTSCIDGVNIDCDVCFPYIAPDLLAQPYFLFVFPALKFVVVKFLQLFIVARLSVYLRKRIENKLNDNIISFEGPDAWRDRLFFVDYLIQTLLGGGKLRIRSRVSLVAPESRDALNKAYGWFRDPAKHSVLQSEATEVINENAIHLQSCMLNKYEVMKICYDITRSLKVEKNVDDNAILEDIEEWFFSQVCLGGQRVLPDNIENRSMLRRCIAGQIDVRQKRQVKFFVPEVDIVYSPTESATGTNATPRKYRHRTRQENGGGDGANDFEAPGTPRRAASEFVSQADMLEGTIDRFMKTQPIVKVSTQNWATRAKEYSVRRRKNVLKQEEEAQAKLEKELAEEKEEDDRIKNGSLDGVPSAGKSTAPPSAANLQNNNNPASTKNMSSNNNTSSKKNLNISNNKNNQISYGSNNNKNNNNPKQPVVPGKKDDNKDDDSSEYEEYEEEFEEEVDEEEPVATTQQKRQVEDDGFDLVDDDEVPDAHSIEALTANRIKTSKPKKIFRRFRDAVTAAARTLIYAADQVATDAVQAVQEGQQVARDTAAGLQSAAKAAGMRVVDVASSAADAVERNFDHLRETMFDVHEFKNYKDPEDVDPWDAEDATANPRQLKMPAISTHLGSAISCSDRLNSNRTAARQLEAKNKKAAKAAASSANNTNIFRKLVSVGSNNNNNNLNSGASTVTNNNNNNEPTTEAASSPNTPSAASIGGGASTDADANFNEEFDNLDCGADLEGVEDYVPPSERHQDGVDGEDADDMMDDGTGTASPTSSSSSSSAAMTPRTAEVVKKKKAELLKRRADQYVYRPPTLRSDKVTLMFRSALVNDSLEIVDEDESLAAAAADQDDENNNNSSTNSTTTTTSDGISVTATSLKMKDDKDTSVSMEYVLECTESTKVTRVMAALWQAYRAYKIEREKKRQELEQQKKKEQEDLAKKSNKTQGASNNNNSNDDENNTNNTNDQEHSSNKTAASAAASSPIVVAPPPAATIREHLRTLDAAKSELVVLFDYAGTRFKIDPANTVKDLFQHTVHFSLETKTSANFKCNITGREAKDSQKKLGKSYMRLVQMRFLAVDDLKELQKIESLGALVMKPFVSSELTVNTLRNRFVQEAIIDSARYPMASLRLDTIEFVSRLLNTSFYSRVLEGALWAIGEETFFESDLTTKTRYKDRNHVIEQRRLQKQREEQTKNPWAKSFGGTSSSIGNNFLINENVTNNNISNNNNNNNTNESSETGSGGDASGNLFRADPTRTHRKLTIARSVRAKKIFCHVTQSIDEFKELVEAVETEEMEIEEKQREEQEAEAEIFAERKKGKSDGDEKDDQEAGEFKIDPVPSFCALFEAMTVYQDRGSDRIGVLVTTEKDRGAYLSILDSMYQDVEQTLKRERSHQLTLTALQALVAQYRQSVEQVTSLIKVVKLEAQVMETVFFINIYVVAFSVLYGLAFLIMCGQEAAASGEAFFSLSGPARWLRYEHIYSRFLNSGTPASLIAASVVNFFANKKARSESRWFKIVDYSLLVASFLLVIPATITHLIPGGFAYIWIVLIVTIVFAIPTLLIFWLWNYLVDRAHEMITKNAKGKDGEGNLAIPLQLNDDDSDNDDEDMIDDEGYYIDDEEIRKERRAAKRKAKREIAMQREDEEQERLSSLGSLKAAMTGICVWIYLVVLIVLTAATQTLFNWAFLMYHQSDFDLNYRTIPDFEFASRRTQCYAVGVFANVANTMQFASSFIG